MAWYTVDKRLISIKAFYFFIFAGVASLVPYLPIFLAQLGLSSAEIATIYGLIFLTTFVKNSAVGYIADRYQLHKIILIASCVLTGPLYCSLIAVPSVENLVSTRPNLQLHCSLASNSLLAETNASGLNSAVSSSVYQCSDETTGDLVSHGSCHPYILEQPKASNCSLSSVLVQNLTSLYSIIGTNESQSNISASYLPHTQSLAACQVSVTCSTPPPSYTSFTFWLCLFIVLMAALCGSNEMMLNDAIAMTVLGEDRAKWGISRLFGSIGYGVCAIQVSILIVGLGLREEPINEGHINYRPAFYVYLCLSVISAIVACFHPNSQSIKVSQEMKGVRTILSDVRVVLFLLLILLLGMFNGVTMTFGYLYLRMNLKASQLVLGSCVLVSVLAEIPTLFVGGKIVNKIGTRTTLYLALFAYFVRLIGYVYIPDAWWAPLVEITHMFTFGLMFTAATMHASKLSSQQTIGTMIGLINGLKWGLGLALGSFIGGQVVQPYGFQFLFKTAGITALIVMVVYIIINEVLVRCLCPLTAPETDVPAEPESTPETRSAEEIKLYSQPTTPSRPPADTCTDQTDTTQHPLLV